MRNLISIKKIFLIGALFILGLFLHPGSASAQTAYNSLVNIPGIKGGAGVTAYLSGLYNFLISVVGLVAMGAIVIGGTRYLTSVGNPSAIEDAKRTIWAAIYGLILAITSWVIVTTINPDITVLKNPSLTMPTGAYGAGSGGSKTVQCALPAGDPVNGGCFCVDNPETPIFGKSPFPPYVVSTTPSPCSANVPLTLPLIVINFNEPMDPTTVMTAGAITVSPAVTGTPSMINGNAGVQLALTAPLTAATDYTITVAGGGSFNKNVAGAALAANYVFKFSTNPTLTGCTVPSTGGSPCTRVCGDKTLAMDGKYHCLKADLRAGKTMLDASSKTIWGKVNETIFFDLDTYSVHGNPIIRYELGYEGDPFLGIFSDVGCSTVVNTCAFPIPTSPCSGKPKDLNHKYPTAGTYTVWAKIMDDKCNWSEDRIDITIENL